MLSDVELEELQTVNVLLSGEGVAALTDAHRIVWERWDDALATATKQLRCQIQLTAMISALKIQQRGIATDIEPYRSRLDWMLSEPVGGLIWR